MFLQEGDHSFERSERSAKKARINVPDDTLSADDDAQLSELEIKVNAFFQKHGLNGGWIELLLLLPDRRFANNKSVENLIAAILDMEPDTTDNFFVRQLINWKITDNSIEIMASRYYGLAVVCFDGCAMITDLALLILTSSHDPSLLRCASFNGCSNITDVGVEALAQCLNLTAISLADCYKVTDVSALELLRCRDLQVINLARCKVTGQTLEALILQCGCIKSLNLNGTYIIPVDVEPLAHRYSNILEGLFLETCSLINISELTMKCVFLKYLSIKFDSKNFENAQEMIKLLLISFPLLEFLSVFDYRFNYQRIEKIWLDSMIQSCSSLKTFFINGTKMPIVFDAEFRRNRLEMDGNEGAVLMDLHEACHEGNILSTQ